MELTVLYDDRCSFCVHCASWLATQRQIVPLELLSRNDPSVNTRFPSVCSNHDELVVIDDAGGIYRDTDAFIMCMWALEQHRALALRIADGPLAPLGRSMLRALSSNRSTFSTWMSQSNDRELEFDLTNDLKRLEAAHVLPPDQC